MLIFSTYINIAILKTWVAWRMKSCWHYYVQQNVLFNIAFNNMSHDSWCLPSRGEPLMVDKCLMRRDLHHGGDDGLPWHGVFVDGSLQTSITYSSNINQTLITHQHIITCAFAKYLISKRINADASRRQREVMPWHFSSYNQITCYITKYHQTLSNQINSSANINSLVKL